MADTDPRIVSATGTAGRSGGLTSKAIEAAMIKATEDCQAAGITDPEQIKAHKMKARERVKAEATAAAAIEAQRVQEADAKARAEALARLGQ